MKAPQSFVQRSFSIQLTKIWHKNRTKLWSQCSIVTYQELQMFLKNVIHQNDQIDSTNKRLLLLTSFTAKFELVYVLTQENAFSWRFLFKANRKSIGTVLLQNGTRNFQNRSPFERSACFYGTIIRNFDRFQYFDLARNFWITKTFSKILEYRFLV